MAVSDEAAWRLSVSMEGSGKRLGVLSSQACATRRLDTPACFALTETGSVPNLSPAHCRLLPPHGLALLVPHFHLSFDAIAQLSSRPGARGGVRGYAGLGDDAWLHVMIGSDSHPAAAGVGCDAPTGRFQLTPGSFAGVVRACRPDSFSSMSWPVGSAAGAAGKNLMRKAVDKTIEWARSTAAELSNSDDDQTHATLQFRTIGGGGSLPDRRVGAQAAVHDRCRAFDIAGLGSGESSEERAAILTACCQALPADAPRLVAGIGSPEEVLHAVEHGVDIIVTDYPTSVSAWAMALVFPFDAPLPAAKINLRDPQHQTDSRPILEHCSCYACSHHSRAYIHHLLNVQEMLASTLLQMHNWHHYLSWFATLRSPPSE